MPKILSIDPSGTSISGLFYFENWNGWENNHIETENWLNQAEKIETYLKNKQVEILLVETGHLFKNQRYSYQMPALIKLVGLLEYLCLKNGIEYHLISNRFMNKWESEAKEGKINGLELKKVQGKNGRPRNVWYFKDKELNEHEKDAVLIFFIYWVKKLGKNWPWS